MHRPHQGIEPESQCQTLVHSLAPVTTSHSATVSKHSPLCRCEAAMTAFKGIWTQQFWRAVCGEFLATLIFVLLGTGSTIGCDGKSGPLNIVLISLCFGLSIATMVQCFGHISGGHVNPVVTVAMVSTQKLSLAKGFFYIVGQCFGAIVGAGILYLITPPDVMGGLGATMINENLSVGHGLLVELIITFQLVFTIFATCDPKRDDLKGSAALAIGLSVVIGHLFAINYTGASMNPARSFGPAVITGSWENHWVYWVGPMMGGVIAAVLYKYLFCPDKELRHQLNRSQAIEYKDLVVKPGSSEVIDIDESEEKKEKDATKELLSSV
ncbi:aquaporin-4 isoform X1 [Scyliorhinus canicula]|uniref:aquaporin-4 isoform X1 n=2 Tax=Scyliorhinus canicula TaxID=7830 RepID=UPI0018F2E1E2|nr:aquaporin-4 isoform X1 [Scyliorhinus canicula]